MVTGKVQNDLLSGFVTFANFHLIFIAFGFRLIRLLRWEDLRLADALLHRDRADFTPSRLPTLSSTPSDGDPGLGFRAFKRMGGWEPVRDGRSGDQVFSPPPERGAFASAAPPSLCQYWLPASILPPQLHLSCSFP